MAAEGVEVAIARRKATPCIIVVGSVATGAKCERLHKGGNCRGAAIAF